MAGVAGMGKPQALTPSTPEQMQPQVPDIGTMALPQVPAAQAAPNVPPPDDELESLFAQMSGGETQVMEADAELENLFAQMQGDELAAAAQEPTGYDSTPPTLGEQLSDAPTRFRASFAKTDKEKKFVLESKFGAENVKKAGDDFLIKRDNKWKKFDSDSFEIIGDLADFAREGLEEIGTTAGTILGIGGAAAETAATAGVGLPAAPLVVAGGRAAGAAAGLALADAYQAYLGIPRDPERSYAKEYAVGASLGVLGGKAADWMGEKIASRAARKAVEARKVSDLGSVARNSANDVVEASERLRAEGLISNVDGYDVAILPSQAALLDPDVQGMAKELADQPSLKNFILKQGEMFGDAFKDLADSVSNFSGPKKNTGTQFVNVAEGIEKAEGQVIGEFRKKALDAAGDGEIPVAKLQAKLDEVAEKLGFSAPDGVAKPPSVDDLVNMGWDEKAATDIIRRVGKLSAELSDTNGRIPMKRLDGLYREMSALTTNLYKRGMNADALLRNEITGLKNAVRDDYTNAIGTILEGDTKTAYQSALNKFSTIKSAAEDLSGVLSKDQISANALSGYLFKGANNLDRIKAARTIVEQNNPGAWKDVTGQMLTDIVGKHTDTGSGKTNWARVTSDINKMGPEVLAEVFPGKERQLQDMIKLFSAAEQGGPELLAQAKNRGLLKNGILAVQSIFAAASAGSELFSRWDKQKEVAKFISQNGIDSVTRGLPKKDAGAVKQFLTKYMERQNQLAMKAIPASIRRADETVGAVQTEEQE